MSRCRSKFICIDCGVDTGKIHEHYFVHDNIWLSITESKKGMLCIGCIEERLGRPLNSLDFPNVSINNPKYEDKSNRLMSRMIVKHIGLRVKNIQKLIITRKSIRLKS